MSRKVFKKNLIPVEISGWTRNIKRCKTAKMNEISDDPDEPPPNSQLEAIIENVRPMVRVGQTVDDHEGTLQFVAKKDPYKESFFYGCIFEEEVNGARYLEEIHFFHEYEKEGVLKPKLHEIARSIPERYKDKELGVEMVMEMKRIYRVNGYYKIPAKIYEIEESCQKD